MNKNNNKVFVNHQVRFEGKKINIFNRINKIKNDLKELIPEIEEDKFLSMLSHIRNFYYNKLYFGRVGNKEKKKKELTANEKIILDYLIKNNLNPSTTYRWFIACRLPSDIKEKLSKGQISFKKAVIIADNRKKSKLSNTGLLMIEEINNTIQSL